MKEKVEQFSIFNRISSGAIEKILDKTNQRELTEGEILFESGEPGQLIYIIVEGLVKICVDDSLSERKKTITLLSEGELVGEMAGFGSQTRSARARAIKDTTLLAINPDKFIELFKNHPQIGLNLIRELSQRLLATDREIYDLTFQNVSGRLAACLLRLAKKFGSSVDSGRQIDIDLTHRRLAELLGTNRETVTRQLKKFKKSGAIKTENQKIIISDQEKLESWL